MRAVSQKRLATDNNINNFASAPYCYRQHSDMVQCRSASSFLTTGVLIHFINMTMLNLNNSINWNFLLSQVRSRTRALGRDASGASPAPTSSPATTASTPAPSPSSAPTAAAGSRAATTSPSTPAGTREHDPLAYQSVLWFTFFKSTTTAKSKIVSVKCPSQEWHMDMDEICSEKFVHHKKIRKLVALGARELAKLSFGTSL